MDGELPSGETAGDDGLGEHVRVVLQLTGVAESFVGASQRGLRLLGERRRRFREAGGLGQDMARHHRAQVRQHDHQGTDLLDTGTIVWIVSDTAKDAAKLHKDALYADLKVTRQNREVFIKETSDYGNAVSFVTVLSLPYMLDRLVPQLAAAVDGDPATKVPAPTA
ncbi:hypothetical protein ACF07B_24385 [Streptomyces sp. NPDC015532]|uniref:hypothetical protein n=1 Tax=unclassified Streptomyces TaxID=2593676 RepID=UPI0036FA6FBE